MQLYWTQQTGTWTLAITLTAIAVWILKLHISEYKKKLKKDQQLKEITQKQHTYNSIYQSLFESIHDGIFIYRDEKLVDCNKHALNIYCQPREFFEKQYPSVCSPLLQPNGENSAEMSRKFLEQALQGYYQHFEWVHTRKNGQCFDADVSIFPFESEQTNLLTVIVRDITERKTMERELYHIKNNLENLIYQQTQSLSEANTTLNERNKELANANSQLYEAAVDLKQEVEHRKELQRLLEESQEILKSFIAQSPVGISIINYDGRILDWNPEMVAMTGIDEQTAFNAHAEDLNAQIVVNKERHTAIKNEMARYLDNLENEKDYKIEEHYLRADKSVGCMERIIFPIITNDKRLVGLICRDLTKQKQLEAKQEEYNKQIETLILAQSEKNIDLFQKLTTIFNNTNTNIAFFHIQNRTITITNCNTTWAEALGKNTDDITGKRIDKFYSPEQVSLISNIILTAVESQRKINKEVIWEHKGTNYYLDFSVIPIGLENNQPITQIACIYRDITEKRKMERALLEREARLARAQELAHLGSWNWNLRTGEMHLSREMYKIYEFNPEIPIKLPNAIFDAIHPDDYNRVFEHVNHSREDVNSTSIEHRIKLKSGRIKHLLVINNTIGDSNGIPIIIEGTTQDITEQKLLEQSIRESEEKFRKIFNSSLDTISLIDCETDTYYDINNQFIKLTGLEKEDVIGKTRDEVNVWAYPSEREEYTKIRNKDGRVLNFHMHWNMLGGPRNFLLSTERISINNKLFYLTISVDIDEQQRMALALVESEVKFRNIFNAASDGILLTTHDLKFIDCNPALLGIIGFTKDEIASLSLNHFIPESIIPLLLERIKLLSKKRPSPALEIFIKHKNGAIIPVEISSKIVKLGERKIILTQVRNLSERKKMEEMLITSTIEAEENERRKLAQDLHDDVGPLLSSMNMYLSLLARKPEIKPHEAIVKDIEKILKETMATVREISNKISPHILINYGLIAALNSFFRNNERLVPIHLSNNLNEERLPSLTELMLFRIIKEAYNNTVKHAEATEVVISITRIDNSIQIEYRDNGKGFDMANRPTKSVGGLGLHTIQSRLATIGGQFIIKTAPGEGFYMYISLAFA